MNIKKFSEQILHNWPIKIICLVVAIFLYIFHQTSLVDHKNFVVPLNIIENGQVMHVQKLTDSITLSVKALPEDISNIHVSDFSAILDLSYLTESGEYEIPIQVNTNDSLKQFETLEIKIKPSASLMVKVEKKITKYIPLEVSVSGEPAYGYKLESVSVEPSSVAVVGPQSIVSKIDKLYSDKFKGVFDDDDFQRIYANLKEERSENEKRVENLRRKAGKQESADEIKRVIKNFYDTKEVTKLDLISLIMARTSAVVFSRLLLCGVHK